MRNKLLWTRLVIGCFIITAAFCFFFIKKKLSSWDGDNCCGQAQSVEAELPWERMVHPFVGSVLFK